MLRIQRHIVFFIALMGFQYPLRSLAEITTVYPLTPGSELERSMLVSGAGTRVDGEARTAEIGGAWTWRMIVPPDARCKLTFKMTGAPVFSASGADGKPLKTIYERFVENGTVQAALPANHPVGGSISLRVSAVNGPVSLHDVLLTIILPETNTDGISDFAKRLMGLTPSQHALVFNRDRPPHTLMRAGALNWSPMVGIPVDAVRVSPPAQIEGQSLPAEAGAVWMLRGYKVFTEPFINETAPFSIYGRLGGARLELPFEMAMLSTGKSIDPTNSTGSVMAQVSPRIMEDGAVESNGSWSSRITAGLMNTTSSDYLMLEDPLTFYTRAPRDRATVMNTVTGALSEMWRYRGELQAGSAGFGAVSENAESAPEYALPLVAHGIPVRPIDRTMLEDTRELAKLKVLYLPASALSGDKPVNVEPLARWVRDGGSLVLFLSPLLPAGPLLSSLGISSVGARVVDRPDEIQPGKILAQSETNAARSRITVDLSKEIQPDGSAHVRISPLIGTEGDRVSVSAVELRFGEKLALSFRSGSEMESRFLEEERSTLYDGTVRYAENSKVGPSDWGYIFTHLPGNQPVRLTLDIAGKYAVRSIPSIVPPGLLVQADPGFGPFLERIRIWPSESITLLKPPFDSKPLFRMEGDDTPVVWDTRVERGHVLGIGLKPAFCTATAQRGRWVRAIAERAFETKDGVVYKEAPAYVMQRGPYSAVHAINGDYSADGRFVNLLSPTLAVSDELTTTGDGNALVMEVRPKKGTPSILAVSGRLVARSEQVLFTSFIVTAPTGTDGVTRLLSKRAIRGAKAFTMMGRPISVSIFPDGDTYLLRYPNDADGVVIKVGWGK